MIFLSISLSSFPWKKFLGMTFLGIKPKRKECALVESKTVKIQILRIENKGM
jgi:hypothetical protein